jgi:hypothetical protein
MPQTGRPAWGGSVAFFRLVLSDSHLPVDVCAWPAVHAYTSLAQVQATLGIDSIVCVIDATNLLRSLDQWSALVFEQLSLVRWR